VLAATGEIAEAAEQHADYIKTEVLAVDLAIVHDREEGMLDLVLGDATASVSVQKR